jgi:hypothetical protein
VNSLSVPSLDSMKLIHGKERRGYEKEKNSLILDRHTRKAVNINNCETDAIPPVSDLDLAVVNRVLYASDTK